MLRLLLLFLLIFFSSCTFLDKLALNEPEFSESFDVAGTKKAASLPKKATTDTQQKKAPLNIEVAQAFFDQDKLNIKVILTTQTEIDPRQIVVGVAGLSEGELVEETYKKISDIVASDELDANTKIAVRFELGRKDLSEYQVRCSWGKEAEELWAKLSQPIDPTTSTNQARASLATNDNSLKDISKDLRLSDLDIQSEEAQCVTAPCDLVYTIVGKFHNGKEQTVSTAKLAVGLYWANSGQIPEIPESTNEINENEEVVEVALGLKSQESATVRIKLDKNVPQVPGGSFVPHIRLISSE